MWRFGFLASFENSLWVMVTPPWHGNQWPCQCLEAAQLNSITGELSVTDYPPSAPPASEAMIVVQLKVTWGLSRSVCISLYKVSWGKMLSLLLPKTSSPVYLSAISIKRYQKLRWSRSKPMMAVHPMASTWTRASMQAVRGLRAECWMLGETSPRPQAETWEIDTPILEHGLPDAGLQSWWSLVRAYTLRGAEHEDERRLTLKSPCQDFLFDIISILS